jgi:hypothetical protein
MEPLFLESLLVTDEKKVEIGSEKKLGKEQQEIHHFAVRDLY